MEKIRLVQTDQPGFMRDEKTGAIININDSDYRSILVRRAEKKKQEEMVRRMESLEMQMSEILGILKDNATRGN